MLRELIMSLIRCLLIPIFVQLNPIMCYCRWGSGANDYDTVLVQNP